MEKGFFYSVVHDKCPRCNEGNLFVNKNWYTAKNIGEMPDKCAVCGQDYKVEDGFYLGATYISYALSLIVTVPLLAVLYFVFNLDFMWMLPLFIVILVLLMPPVLRVSRSAWINFFVHYDPEWKKIAEKYLTGK